MRFLHLGFVLYIKYLPVVGYIFTTGMMRNSFSIPPRNEFTSLESKLGFSSKVKESLERLTLGKKNLKLRSSSH